MMADELGHRIRYDTVVSAIEVEANVPAGGPPALVTRMSTPPSASDALATNA